MAQARGPIVDLQKLEKLRAKIQNEVKSTGKTDTTRPKTGLSDILGNFASRTCVSDRHASGPKDIAEYEDDLLNWAQKVPYHTADPKFQIMTFLEGRDDATPPVQRRLRMKADDTKTYGALKWFRRYAQNALVEVFFRDNEETDIQFVFWADAQRMATQLPPQDHRYMAPVDLKKVDACLMLGGTILPGVLKYVKCLFSRIGSVKFSDVFSREPSALTTPFPSTILVKSHPLLKTFEHAHFCFIQFSKDDNGRVNEWPLLAALGNLQQRLLVDFELVLMAVPGKFEGGEMHATHSFSVEDYLRRYPQPSQWICPKVLGESAATAEDYSKLSKRQLVTAQVHTISSDQSRVELRFHMGYGKKRLSSLESYGDACGFVDRDEVSDEPFEKLDGVVHVGQMVRARILGQEDHGGYTWYRCSLKDASMLPRTNMSLELANKVQTLRPQDWEQIDAFDVIEGYVVDVGQNFGHLKVDIGYTEDFGFISAEGNQLTWEQVKNDYTVGTQVLIVVCSSCCVVVMHYESPRFFPLQSFHAMSTPSHQGEFHPKLIKSRVWKTCSASLPWKVITSDREWQRQWVAQFITWPIASTWHNVLCTPTQSTPNIFGTPLLGAP